LGASYVRGGIWFDLYDREPDRRKLAYKRFERLAKLDKLVVWGLPSGGSHEKKNSANGLVYVELDEDDGRRSGDRYRSPRENV
jgi:hypothetical protein